jgi:hypothetical protein
MVVEIYDRLIGIAAIDLIFPAKIEVTLKKGC